MDGTVIATAAISGVLALAGTLLGVVVKGRIDAKRFDVEVKARRAEQLLDRRLAAGAAMAEALSRARAELTEFAASVNGDGFAPNGDPAYMILPSRRPDWLTAALSTLEQTNTAAVIDAARAGATTCWDDYRQAVYDDLRWTHDHRRDEEYDEAGTPLVDAREAAVRAAMDAEEHLRDTIRAESRDTTL